MAYSADSFVADEQPTTAKWNKLWTNDASFNDGTGIADDALLSRHYSDASVLGQNMGVPVAFKAARSTAFNLVATSTEVITWNNEIYDYGSNFNGTVFTAPYDGIYHFDGMVQSSAGNERVINFIFVEGVEAIRGGDMDFAGLAGTLYGFGCHGDLELAAGEDVDFRVYTDDGVDSYGLTPQAYFSGFLVGRT